jgi:hypothetical protein
MAALEKLAQIMMLIEIWSGSRMPSGAKAALFF